MQHADAEELAQEVLVAVARAVDRWQPDPERGRFRDWLFRIARNAIINFLTRPKHQRLGSGSSGVHATARTNNANLPVKSRRCSTSSTAARCSAGRRRGCSGTVTESTWQAFWLTSVDCAAGGRSRANAGHERGQRLRRPQPRDGQAAR